MVFFTHFSHLKILCLNISTFLHLLQLANQFSVSVACNLVDGWVIVVSQRPQPNPNPNLEIEVRDQDLVTTSAIKQTCKKSSI